MNMETIWHYADPHGRQQGPMYIGLLMAAFTERQQALHDVVASTLVTDRWAFTDHPERQSQTAGCLVALLIGALLIVPVIAIPAYQGYVQRAQIAGAIAQAMPPEQLVDQAWLANRRCPGNGMAGICDADSYASGQLQSINVDNM